MPKSKDIYSNYINDDLWLIKETEWVRESQSVIETQFSLGNGYLGTRGIYEEIPYDCIPGTYIAGIYDAMASQVSEMVNFPNPINFKFSVGGEKLGLIAMSTVNHKRVLNMKKAVLARQTVYKDSKNRCYDYQSVRFISQDNKNIGVMQIALTPLDAACVLDINTGIDTSVSNAGVLTEGRKKHFRVKELGQHKGAGYLVQETFDKKHTVVYWAGFYYHLNNKKVVSKDNVFSLKLKKNQTVVFTKVFFIKHYPHKDAHITQKNEAYSIFSKAFKSDFSTLLKSHVAAWDKLWKRADVVIEGTANIQQNMRFNIYHMLSCLHYDNGFSSIGARTLSGEGYRGHIFWDAEIFVLPFYLFTFPKVAKNMLLYRYQRLDESRKIAKENGYKGVQFAWESAGTGEEETPHWAMDIDRTVIKIHTHKMEHHLTADIAYAINKYYMATGDIKFMQDAGYEMLIETARFWVSRVEHNKKKDKYEIKNVIGPDEFHVGVNNNAFTNMMAKWNLFTTAKIIEELKKTSQPYYEKLKKKINLSNKEISSWKRVASRIITRINKKGIIEQSDGFFKLKKVTLGKTDENGIPLIPAKIKAKDLGKTQIIKQADVLMLIYLLNDIFNDKTKVANYNFYIDRTVHKSSLSAPMHAFVASEVGDLHRAYNLFNVAMRTDISNLYGNTPEGIHAASLGGTWQTLVFGFGGVMIKRGELFINPRMPRSWRKLKFSLCWRGSIIKLQLTNDLINIRVSCSKYKNVKIGIFGKLIILKTNKNHTFKRNIHGLLKEEYY